MDRSPAEQELNRIERELDANEPEANHLRSGVVVRVVKNREESQTEESQTTDPWMSCWSQRCCYSLLPQHWCSQAGLAPHNGCN